MFLNECFRKKFNVTFLQLIHELFCSVALTFYPSSCRKHLFKFQHITWDGFSWYIEIMSDGIKQPYLAASPHSWQARGAASNVASKLCPRNESLVPKWHRLVPNGTLKLMLQHTSRDMNHFKRVCFMMTSWNENIFRVTGPLCGESTGHRWIPLVKASDAELWCFLWSVPEQTVEQTIETTVIRDAIVLIITSLQCTNSINCTKIEWNRGFRNPTARQLELVKAECTKISKAPPNMHFVRGIHRWPVLYHTMNQWCGKRLFVIMASWYVRWTYPWNTISLNLRNAMAILAYTEDVIIVRIQTHNSCSLFIIVDL